MERCEVEGKRKKKRRKFLAVNGGPWWKRHQPELAFIMALLCTLAADGQDGNAGINEANSMIRGYFPTVVNLMYGVGAIMGIIGAIRVYQKMTNGDHDVRQTAASWFGACIFLVVVAAVIQSFFGV